MSILTQVISYRAVDATDYFLNDRTSLRSGWVTSPHYYIKIGSAEGFYGTDIESETHSIPHAIGEKSGDSFRKGKGISLSGTIEGRNINDLIAASAYLRQVFWDTSPRKLVYVETTGDTAYYLCRVLNDLSIVENFDGWNPKWTWTVGLRADDPRPRKLSDNSLVYSWMT
jgi:hypothetical protein